MKRYFMPTWLVVSAIALAGVLTACGDDDDDNGGGSPSVPVNPSTGVVSYNVEYDLDLSDAYYNFYDITLTYTDADGLVKTRELTADFEYEFDVPANKVSDSYVLKVVGTVKSSLPEISAESLYTFAKEGDMEVKAKTADGKSSTEYYNSIVASSMTVRGNKVAEYVSDRHPEIVFADYIYTVKK